MNTELIKNIIDGRAKFFTMNNVNYGMYKHHLEDRAPKRGDTIAILDRYGAIIKTLKYRSKNDVVKPLKTGSNEVIEVYVLGDKTTVEASKCRILHAMSFEEIKALLEQHGNKINGQRENYALKVKKKTGVKPSFINPQELGGTPQRNEPCSCGSGVKYKKCCAL